MRKLRTENFIALLKEARLTINIRIHKYPQNYV